MTYEQIEAIRKRAEKATKGPWERLNGVDVFTPLNTTNNHGVTSDYNDGWHIATCDGFNTSVNGEESELNFAEIKANADFIANAREDIPALLAEVERLQAKLTDATSICLWSARRLPTIYKAYAYDYIDELTNEKSERL